MKLTFSALFWFIAGEEELLATRMLLDVPSADMTPQEQMVMESGMYGVGSVGQYGGLPDGTNGSTTDVPTTTDTGALTPESAQESSTSTTPTTTTTTQAKASSASTAQMSLMAGAVAAAAILLL